MGYSGKLEFKQLAVNLRKEGLSYKEILLKIPVSKNSISRWCRDITLSETQEERLISLKVNGQQKASFISAHRKRERREQEKKLVLKESLLEIGTIDDRDFFVAGLMLYAGEGDKGEYKTAFTNADPRLIEFMMKWFIKFCNIPLEKFRGAIWIHEGLDANNSKVYWSSLTGIPQNQFHKTYIAKVKNDSKKIRKNIHSYGVFSIRFSGKKVQSKILGWIYTVIDAKISKVR